MPTTEHQIQKQIIAWRNLPATQAQFPWIQYLFAIPNGARMTPGTAGKMKAEGLSAGVPDLCLPVPNPAYHGLYIEMKTPSGAVRPEQKRWIAGLRAAGYRVEIHRSADDAQHSLMHYLSKVTLPPPPELHPHPDPKITVKKLRLKTKAKITKPQLRFRQHPPTKP